MDSQLVDQQSRGRCTSVVKVQSALTPSFSTFTPSLLRNTTAHNVSGFNHTEELCFSQKIFFDDGYKLLFLLWDRVILF